MYYDVDPFCPNTLPVETQKQPW